MALDPRLVPFIDLLVERLVRDLVKENAAVVPAKESDSGVKDDDGDYQTRQRVTQEKLRGVPHSV